MIDLTVVEIVGARFGQASDRTCQGRLLHKITGVVSTAVNFNKYLLKLRFNTSRAALVASGWAVATMPRVEMACWFTGVDWQPAASAKK